MARPLKGGTCFGLFYGANPSCVDLAHKKHWVSIFEGRKGWLSFGPSHLFWHSLSLSIIMQLSLVSCLPERSTNSLEAGVHPIFLCLTSPWEGLDRWWRPRKISVEPSAPLFQTLSYLPPLSDGKQRPKGVQRIPQASEWLSQDFNSHTFTPRHVLFFFFF